MPFLLDNMFKNRIDQNQKEIVQLLRNKGAAVFVMDRVKSGFPDLVICYRGCTILAEVKTPNGTLTEAQQEFFLQHGHYAKILRTKADVLKLLENVEGYLTHNQSLANYLNGK